MKESQALFEQSLQSLSEKIRSLLHSISQPSTPTDKPLHLEKSGYDSEHIFHNIAKVLSQAQLRPEDLAVSSESYTSLFALKLASILADSPHIDSASKDVFMSQIHSTTSQWLSSLFGFWQTKSVTFFRSELESLRQVFQASLERKYDQLKIEGFPALYSRPPTIYIPDHSHYPFMVESICSSLFLPKSNIRLVPMQPGTTKMSTQALEELINEDAEEGKMPSILIARVGTHLTGEVDDLKALRSICDRHSMWLHVEGHGLAMLGLQKALPETLSSVVLSADSATITPGRWLALPAFPAVTFYRNVAFTQLPRTHFPEVFLTFVYLQSIGQQHIANHVATLVDSARVLVAKLLSTPHLRVFPRAFDSQSILFHYTTNPSTQSTAEENTDLVLENAITTHISHLLIGKTLGVDKVHFEGRILLRFQLFSPHVNSPKQNVEAYAAALADEIQLIQSTLQFRSAFAEAIKEVKSLRSVQVEDGWFGLGALRYTPPYIKDEVVSIEVEQDVNELNSMMVDSLTEQDVNLFRHGVVANSNRTCILVGVDRTPMTAENTIQLVQIILDVANKLEKSEKFIGGLAALVKKGIREAESEMKKESDQRDQGLLQQIPLVGSLFGMFSSPAVESPKNKAVKSFDIGKGKLDHVAAPPRAAPKQKVPYAKERKIAISAVEYACKVCEEVQKALASDDKLTKKDTSPVTVADFASQAIINLALADAFPNDPVVGEEDSKDLKTPEGAPLRAKVVHWTNEVLGTNFNEETILQGIDRGNFAGSATGRFWTLDPIDGTMGFLRKGQYAICLALVVDGEVVLGVMGCPNLPLSMRNEKSEKGCIFVAVKGQGAFQRSLKNGTETSISVSKVENTAEASFCESVEASHSSHGDSAAIAQELQITKEAIRMDSQCKYAAIARGDASIYLRLPTRADYREKIWDHASGYLLVREAGGQVDDVLGSPLNFRLGRTLAENSGVIATNGHIHARVLEVVKSVLNKKAEAVVENGSEHTSEKPAETETPQAEATVPAEAAVPAEAPVQPSTEATPPQEAA